MLYKNHIFQCMSKIFCMEFQTVPLKFHTKYLTHTLKSVFEMTTWDKTFYRLIIRSPGPRLNIKTVFPRYGDSHVKDETVTRPSYLFHGDPYAGKTASLYWDSPRLKFILVPFVLHIKWNMYMVLLYLPFLIWVLFGLINWYASGFIHWNWNNRIIVQVETRLSFFIKCVVFLF